MMRTRDNPTSLCEQVDIFIDRVVVRCPDLNFFDTLNPDILSHLHLDPPPKLNGYKAEATPGTYLLIKLPYEEGVRFSKYANYYIKSLLLESEIADTPNEASRIVNGFLNSGDPEPDNMNVFKYLKDDLGNLILQYFSCYIHQIKNIAFLVTGDARKMKGTFSYKKGLYKGQIGPWLKILYQANKILKRGGCFQVRIMTTAQPYKIEEASFDSPFERLACQLSKMEYVISSTKNSYENYCRIFEAFNEIITVIRNHDILHQGLEAIRCFETGDSIGNILNNLMSNEISFERDRLFNYAFLIGLTYMKIVIEGFGTKNNGITYYKEVAIYPNAMDNEENKFIFSIKYAKDTVSSFINHILNKYCQLDGYRKDDFSIERIKATQHAIVNQNQKLYNKIKPYIIIIKKMQTILNTENILGLSMIKTPEKPYLIIEPIRVNLNLEN